MLLDASDIFLQLISFVSLLGEHSEINNFLLLLNGEALIGVPNPSFYSRLFYE